MSAFDDAAAALHADPNLSRPALYRVGGAGDGTPLRVIFSQPAREENFGQTDKIARDLMAEVRFADIAAPAKGDTLQIGQLGAAAVQTGDPLYAVATVRNDDENISAALTLRPTS